MPVNYIYLAYPLRPMRLLFPLGSGLKASAFLRLLFSTSVA